LITFGDQERRQEGRISTTQQQPNNTLGSPRK
jgi:hypothetical protein